MSAFPTPEPITATLTTAGARVRVTASERTDTVVRVEPIDSANKSDVKVAENTKVDFSAGELSIKTTKSGGKNGSVAITIELPVGSRLALNLAWTDVRANGRLGDCTLDMASGQVQLGHIAALRANLKAGEIAIGSIAGTADIEGAAAGVRIGEAKGTVTYQGSTGRIWIGHALSDVELGSARGSFDIDRAEGNVIAKAGDCPIRVGRMTRGQAELMNASGGIEVGITEGTPASLDAKSTKGAVRSSLPTQPALADVAEAAEAQVKVYARTRLDDIIIHSTAA